MMSPHTPLAVMGVVADLIAGLGCVQAVVGAALVRRFGRHVPPAAWPAVPLPPVTVLKPLHGDAPLAPAVAGRPAALEGGGLAGPWG